MRCLGLLLGLLLPWVAASPAAAPAVAAEASVVESAPVVPSHGGVRAARKAGFPTARSAGVPRGWTPRRTVEGDLTVSQPGAVLEDVRVLGDLVIAAEGVTVNRVEVVGGVIENWRGSTCHTGLKVKRTTIRTAPGQVTEGDFPALSTGGYTARRVAIIGHPEGFRVGGKDECGSVKIVNSYARVVSPTSCGDWHGDALQGYDGGQLILRNSTLKLVERDGCGGTAPFFYPSDQGNTSVSIDGLLVSGGGYSFRLGMPGTVQGLRIEAGSYYYGPIDVRCSVLSDWDAAVVAVKDGRLKATRPQRCNTEGGS